MNKEALITSILREYAKERYFAENKRNADKELAMQNYDFVALDHSYSSLVLASLYLDGTPLDAANAELFNIRKKQKALLKKLAIDDFFDESHRCALCRDTGYLDGALCDCVKRQLTAALIEDGGARVPECSFNGFDVDIFGGSSREKMQKIYSFAKKYSDDASSKDPDRRNILISGGTGTGKTYLVACVYHALLEHCVFAEYMTAFAIGGLFLKAHTSPPHEKNDILAGLFDTDFLIIDDLGTEPMLSNVTKEYLFNLLNERLLSKKPVLISTNLSPLDLLDRYGERVFSRLCNKESSVLIKMPGKDSGKDIRIKTSLS